LNKSAKTPTKVSKKERTEMRVAEANRRKYRRWAGWTIGVFLALGALGWLLAEQQQSLPGEAVPVMEDQSHIPDVTSPHTPYNSDPPTSGPHVENIARWGVHQEPLPKELLVHNLEDGGVVIYYNRSADEAAVKQLEAIVGRYPQHVVLVPYPEMDNPITLTAWGRMDRLQTPEEERIVRFIEAYAGIDHHK